MNTFEESIKYIVTSEFKGSPQHHVLVVAQLETVRTTKINYLCNVH